MKDCAKCGNPLAGEPKEVQWFRHNIPIGHGRSVEVVLRAEVKNPPRGRLCSRCTGDVIANASATTHAGLVAMAAAKGEPPPNGDGKDQA